MNHRLPNSIPAHPDLLVAAVLHLMSHYVSGPFDAARRDSLAEVIERHLSELVALPGLSPILRATCEQLATHWTGLRAAPTPPIGWLRRILQGRRVAE
jgi:hypothetical protein